MEAHIESLISKAAAAGDPHSAMQFSQAALNAAKALNDLRHAQATYPEQSGGDPAK